MAFLCVVALSCLLQVMADAVDLTVAPGATGTEVVEATVQRILQGDIFSDDYSLLRRIAWVESTDGTDEGSFAGGLAGGIWMVNGEAFQKTKDLGTNEKWKSYYLKIKDGGFGIDWNNVTYQILGTPLVSALAARIYVMMTSEPADTVPYDVEEQAAYWKSKYNPEGDKSQFVAKVEELNRQQVCVIGMDVVFALDASLSVGDEGFARSKTFVKQVVNSFNIGPLDDQTRVGCLQFSHKVTVAFDLGDHDTKEDIWEAVDDISYHGGGTAIGTAIDFIRQVSFSEGHGARPPDHAVPRIAIILTDGKTNKEFPVLFPSALARRDGITLYCIGVGNADQADLSVIASRPVASHVLRVLDYEAVGFIRNILATRACKESSSVAVGKPVVADLENGEARFVSYEVDAAEGATLTFMTSSGLVEVYLSSEVPNPNEAVHDYKLQTDGRADLFIDPALLGGGGRSKRSVEGDTPISTSYLTVYTSIYARGNGTKVYVESTEGDTAHSGFPPRPPPPLRTEPPVGDDGESDPQRSVGAPAPRGSWAAWMLAICAGISVLY